MPTEPTRADSHFPFGEQWYPASAPATKWQFTSYERDGGTGESGNDYAMMRYHVNRLGRFSSPDRLAGSIADPQSLHRYAYVFNDPVNFIDPLGLDGGPCFVNGEFGFCDTVGARGGGDSPRMSFGTVGGGFGGGSLDPPPLTYAHLAAAGPTFQISSVTFLTTSTTRLREMQGRFAGDKQGFRRRGTS